LGDTFTWLTHVQIKAHIDDCKPIELVLISLPEKPAHRHQPHITSYNHVQVMEGLLPAFLTCPPVNSLRIFQRKNKVSQRIFGAILSHAPSCPTLKSHFEGLLDPASHSGFKSETQYFRSRYVRQRVPIVINIRQRTLTHDPAALHRDSSADSWYDFSAQAHRRWSNAASFLLENSANGNDDLPICLRPWSRTDAAL